MIPVAGWVAPFGDPGITDRSHLPRAFRSVPRPSSPLSAKASTRCPSSLVHRSLPQKRPHHRRAQGQTPLSRGRLPCPAVSHEDTSRTDPVLEQRGPVRLGHIINALFTLQSTPAPRSPAALFLCFSERPAQPQMVPLGAAPLSLAAGDASPSPVVEVNGLEPMTSCLQSRRSPS